MSKLGSSDFGGARNVDKCHPAHERAASFDNNSTLRSPLLRVIKKLLAKRHAVGKFVYFRRESSRRKFHVRYIFNAHFRYVNQIVSMFANLYLTNLKCKLITKRLNEIEMCVKSNAIRAHVR